MIADMVKQGKSMTEVSERMKSSLSQIRHSKSNRPVFSPEFLARIKQVIVFQPLDEQAMRQIAERQIEHMRKAWREKRERDLVVSETLVTQLGARSHAINEKSDGKEGGRIVRKLVADWIDANVQRAAMAAPEQFATCRQVAVDGIFSADDPVNLMGPPEVTVAFDEQPIQLTNCKTSSSPSVNGHARI